MRNFLRYGPVLAAGVFFAACAGAQTYGGVSVDTSDCQIVTGQTDVNGTLQPFVARACLQPNGTWLFLSEAGSWVAPDDGYSYYASPWVWGAPVLLGSTVVFVDRFHRFHRFDRFHHFDHFGHFNHFDHFRGAGHMPTSVHSPGMHSWGGGRGWGGGMGRR
jgi:surface antigen